MMVMKGTESTSMVADSESRAEGERAVRWLIASHAARAVFGRMVRESACNAVATGCRVHLKEEERCATARGKGGGWRRRQRQRWWWRGPALCDALRCAHSNPAEGDELLRRWRPMAHVARPGAPTWASDASRLQSSLVDGGAATPAVCCSAQPAEPARTARASHCTANHLMAVGSSHRATDSAE